MEFNGYLVSNTGIDAVELSADAFRYPTITSLCRLTKPSVSMFVLKINVQEKRLIFRFPIFSLIMARLWICWGIYSKVESLKL